MIIYLIMWSDDFMMGASFIHFGQIRTWQILLKRTYLNLDIGLEQTWLVWKDKSKIYIVMFHKVWLILMFTRSKRTAKEKIKKLNRNKGNNPRRKNLIALSGTLMNILFKQIK